MKNFVWYLLAIVLLTGTSCEQKINVEKEKEAILAVLQEEGAAMIAKDKERVFDVHVRDSLETRVELGMYGYNTYSGWDELKILLGDVTKGNDPIEDPVNTKENLIIKVIGNSAWLICDNLWKWTIKGEPGGYNNVQIVFLEKIKGEWKISFTAYYSKSMPEEEVEVPVN